MRRLPSRSHAFEEAGAATLEMLVLTLRAPSGGPELFLCNQLIAAQETTHGSIKKTKNIIIIQHLFCLCSSGYCVNARVWTPTHRCYGEQQHVVSTQLPEKLAFHWPAYKKRRVTSHPEVSQIGLCHRSKPPVEPIVPRGCFVYQQRLRVYTSRLLALS